MAVQSLEHVNNRLGSTLLKQIEMLTTTLLLLMHQKSFVYISLGNVFLSYIKVCFLLTIKDIYSGQNLKEDLKKGREKGGKEEKVKEC